jgi:hypothetical protein
MAQRAQDGGRPHIHFVIIEQQDRAVQSAVGQTELLQHALAQRRLRAGKLQPALMIARQAKGDEATAQHAIAVEEVERPWQVAEGRRQLHAGKPNLRRASTVSAVER